ncbi:methionine--tRNA ligase, mitochondrial-like [Paramacrobiotus metropolitanus]|uniref:methionine--tRNA ligase, mitochondrial-like n=1 Tax=Paramacrobiotus metropolitanus TaxID=2943436 RepID=UPI0024465AAA|nr:methionine--tRNA ligase, mitochondrial-like [Paramacrobiotus metropolitanus]
MMNLSRYFVTTPIFYVNAAPHIGHVYSAVLADALHRWHKLKHPADATVFSTGTDEHGLKIQQAAAASNQSPGDFCAANRDKFQQAFRAANIEYTHFVSTSATAHRERVQHAWRCLQERGLLRKGVYAGWYCTSDETFLTESQLRPHTFSDGSSGFVSIESGHRVHWMEEDNYLFPLAQFQDDLKKWIATGPITPPLFNGIVEQWLQERQLPELSVSRSSARLKWGIDVPDDPQQKIYVWLDALLNYLTVIGYPGDQQRWRAFWPADVQVIGKDILKFHAIYWPAFLLALGLQPPRRILCHSHWLVDHQKMSKSLGNVVDPNDCLRRFTVDGFRYFLLREGVPHSDNNYSEEKVISYLNTELANTLGNLLNRCTSTSVNRKQTFPAPPPDAALTDADRTLLTDIHALPQTVAEHFEAFHIYKAIDAVMHTLREVNAYVQDTAPWTLAKSGVEGDQDRLEVMLFVALEALRVAGVLLGPVTPGLGETVLGKLGCGGTRLEVDGGGCGLVGGRGR